MYTITNILWNISCIIIVWTQRRQFDFHVCIVIRVSIANATTCLVNNQICRESLPSAQCWYPQRLPHDWIDADLRIKRPPADPFNLCVFVSNLCGRCFVPAAVFEGQLFYLTGFASHFCANWVQAPALLLFLPAVCLIAFWSDSHHCHMSRGPLIPILNDVIDGNRFVLNMYK